jgi:hypothetical protein
MAQRIDASKPYRTQAQFNAVAAPNNWDNVVATTTWHRALSEPCTFALLQWPALLALLTLNQPGRFGWRCAC